MANTIIKARLSGLLDILDARATINIFVPDGNTQKSIKYAQVYEIISDLDFMEQYGERDVIGIQVSLTTNILINY